MDLKRHTLLHRVAALWPPDLSAGSRIEVGLSGGIDSVVLLHILSALRTDFRFTLQAVHVHHGLNKKADEWADFCNKLCCYMDIPLRIGYVKVASDSGLGVEGEARRRRYRIFSDSPCNILALAHHQDDQVETFMLAALRGGGLRALSAMPQWRVLNERIRIWRPLLNISRQALEDYAAEHGLSYVEDDSNQDTAFLRNWLRNEALPQWRCRVPYLNRHIISSVRLLQNELALLNEVVAQDYAYIYASGVFSITRWKTLSEVRQRQQLLYFAKQNALGVPALESVADFARVLHTMQTVSAEWQLPKGKAYAYQDVLFAQKADWQKNLKWLNHTVAGCLNNILPQHGFILKPYSFGLCEEVLRQECVIRAANAKDVISVAVGKKNVWKILQENKVPPFMRCCWPIIVDTQNQCIAVTNIITAVQHSCPNGVIPVFDGLNGFILGKTLNAQL